jgi:hypothetical protein
MWHHDKSTITDYRQLFPIKWKRNTLDNDGINIMYSHNQSTNLYNREIVICNSRSASSALFMAS